MCIVIVCARKLTSQYNFKIKNYKTQFIKRNKCQLFGKDSTHCMVLDNDKYRQISQELKKKHYDFSLLNFNFG